MFLCGISRRRQGGYPGGHPDPRNFRAIARSAGKSFCADILDPKARTSMTRGGLIESEKLSAGKLRPAFSFRVEYFSEASFAGKALKLH